MAQIEQIECGSSPRQTQLLRMVKFGSGAQIAAVIEIWQGRKFAAAAAPFKIWQLSEFAALAAAIKIWQRSWYTFQNLAKGPGTHAHEVAPVNHNGYYVNLKVEKKYLTLQVKCDII